MGFWSIWILQLLDKKEGADVRDTPDFLDDSKIFGRKGYILVLDVREPPPRYDFFSALRNDFEEVQELF